MKGIHMKLFRAFLLAVLLLAMLILVPNSQAADTETTEIIKQLQKRIEVRP